METTDNTATLKDDLSNLKRKLGHQDGKLFLLSAQIEKYRGMNENGLDQLRNMKELLNEKAEENNKLCQYLTTQKSQLKVATGKIHLLQYQLTKIKDSSVHTYPQDWNETSEKFVLHYFLLHYSKQQKVLASLTELSDLRRRKDIPVVSVTPPRLPQAYSTSVLKKILSETETKPFRPPNTKVVKVFPQSLDSLSNSFSESKNDTMQESSFTYSRLMKNQSLYSETVSQNEISSYSLNTTMEPRYLSVDQSILKTPTLHHSSRLNVHSEGRLRKEAKPSPHKRFNDRDEFSQLILDNESQKNITELKKNVNQGGFSIFSSPVSFRENISKIRVENEKLRHDIYRFRGKLEGMKSELTVMKRNLVK